MQYKFRNILIVTAIISMLITLKCPAFSQIQSIDVTGKITNIKGIPIADVSILIFKDGNWKASGLTDSTGQFSLKIEKGEKMSFRHISYQVKTIEFEGNNVLDIVLEDKLITDINNNNTEVIVVGYQRRTKETVTGAVTRITSDDIKDVPVSNVEQLLQGKVAGLNIQQTTGAPGFRGSASIRGLSQVMVQGSGQNAYLSSQSPLYVIDGIPIDANAGYEYGYQSLGPNTSPLSLIPPEDIVTIDVLKDAQSTALYGSKGANGVIVITTRKGNSKIPIINYTGNFFINLPPELRNTIGGLAERDYRINMIMNTNDYDEIRKISQTQFLSDSLNPFFNNSTDWQGIYYSKTYNQTHNVAVSGGNQKLNYKANFNYYNEAGVIKNTGFDRYSLNLNIGFNPSPKLMVTGYLSASLGNKLQGSGNGLTDVGAGDALSSSLLPGPSYFNNVGQFTSALYSKNEAKTYSNSFYLNIMYELFPHIQVSANNSYDYTMDQQDKFVPALANSNRSYVYGYTGRKETIYNRSMLSYSNTFGKDHNLYASIFSELSIANMKNNLINETNGPNDFYYGPLGFNSYYSDPSGISYTGGISQTHSIGVAANISYNYQQKYVLTLNYRGDGNSYSGLKNRWTKSPSFGLRWNFNKEKLLNELSWLDFGDLRFTYGINLQPTTNIYASLGWYDVNGNYNDVTRISPHLGYMPNPSLKPQKVEQFNYGFDLGLFHSIANMTVDIYTKTVYDLLYNLPLPTSTGFASTFTNDASEYNYGYEITLSFRPLRKTSKVNWNFSINAAVNRDELLSLPGGATQSLSTDGTIINRVGYEALSNFMYISEGVYRTDADVPVNIRTGEKLKDINGIYFQAGDMKFKDVNGDYIIDQNDLQVAGSPTPRITGGFSSYLTWKNFSLNFNGTILFKRDIINNSLYQRIQYMMTPYDDGTLVNLNDLNYWKQQGDVAKYPNPFNYRSNANSYRANQSLYQEDGSYIKLNAITFGYTFNKNRLKKHKINALRLYSTVTNLFMISNYSGPNPESVDVLGRDYLGTYPIARSITLGLNLEF